MNPFLNSLVPAQSGTPATAGGVAGAGGIAGLGQAQAGGGGINDLFQNKLFLQMLAAAGQDIGSGNAIGTNVNATTNQAITAQNFSKMLSQVLGQGGKATIDKKQTKINMPTSMLGDLGGGTQPAGFQSTIPTGGTKQPNPFQLAL